MTQRERSILACFDETSILSPKDILETGPAGLSNTVLSGELKSLVAAGVLERLGHGRYRRAGASGGLEPGETGRSFAFRHKVRAGVIAHLWSSTLATMADFRHLLPEAPKRTLSMCVDELMAEGDVRRVAHGIYTLGCNPDPEPELLEATRQRMRAGTSDGARFSPREAARKRLDKLMRDGQPVRA